MEDTVASTSVTELPTHANSSMEEDQGVGLEVTDSKALEGQAAQSVASSAKEEVAKITEADSSSVDNSSLKEETQPEASSSENKEQASAVVTEIPSHETSDIPESTEPEGQSSQTVEHEHEEKPMEIPLVEETIHVQDKPEEQTAEPEGSGGEAGAQSECTCTSEEHHAKVEQVELPPEPEIVEAAKDSAEAVPSAEHSAAEAPTITVEPAATTQDASTAESPESDVSNATDGQKEHHESQQLTHEEVKGGNDNPLETTEPEPAAAAVPDPVKLEEVPEEIRSADDHSIPETAEPAREADSDSQQEEHKPETSE